MKIVLTQFAIDSHFDPSRAGTTINDRTPEQFEKETNDALLPEYASKGHYQWREGYAPFCKLVYLNNWTDACTGTLPITDDNERFLKSEYKARKLSELPVLVRWFEGIPLTVPGLPDGDFATVPQAKYLGLVLYDREQLMKEGTDIGDADFGIVAILGQMSNEEEPMPPITAMRNALGVEEGGSGVKLDREAYMKSVDFGILMQQ